MPQLTELKSKPAFAIAENTQNALNLMRLALLPAEPSRP
jgi:hypothetical protein